MHKFLTITLSVCCLTGSIQAQETFSIVAVDPATGQVGSAGASCIASSIIISDVHPGVGAVHTQSYWLAANQALAKTLMDLGYSPQEILDSVTSNDAGNDSSIRQYGAVDLVGGGRSAAFTGSNCFDYKNHITGPTYAIQGNILLGQEILDSMQARFLSKDGTLADKLMAALQGANVPGADTRCLSQGTSSKSAFIRVVDTTGSFIIDSNVNNTPFGVEPIDLLQEEYWLHFANCDSFIVDLESNKDTVYLLSDSSVQFFDKSESPIDILEWHWDFGDAMTDSVKNPVHNYQLAGIYVVTLTVKDFVCTGVANDTIYVSNSTGVSESKSDNRGQILINPNPFSNYAYIFIQNLNMRQPEYSNFELYNLVGKKVKSIRVKNEHQYLLRKEDLKSGICIYKVTGKNGSVAIQGKIVVI